jgi:hypothetical protein
MKQHALFISCVAVHIHRTKAAQHQSTRHKAWGSVIANWPFQLPSALCCCMESRLPLRIMWSGGSNGLNVRDRVVSLTHHLHSSHQVGRYPAGRVQDQVRSLPCPEHSHTSICVLYWVESRMHASSQNVCANVARKGACDQTRV